VIDIRFTRDDSARIAAFSRNLVGQKSPRDQLAIIVGRRIISTPVVLAPIAGGQAEIPGFASRAQAENLLRHA
jgi:preprotein translocase subunit SecD